MQLTETFLADFVQIFNEVDADDDGVVSGPQLHELARRLAATEDLSCSEKAKGVLEEAHVVALSAIQGYRRATFSECVELLTGLISARQDAVLEDLPP